MAGTLSGTIAIGAASTVPFAGNSALTAETLESYVIASGLNGAGVLDVASAFASTERNAALTGTGDVMCSLKQIYTYLTNLFGSGNLSGGAFRSVPVSAALTGGGTLSATVAGSVQASVVGVSSVGTTSVTIPAHQVGDVIVIIGYHDGTSSPPSNPAPGGNVPDWREVGQQGFSTQAGICVFYVVAKTTTHTSGTWSGGNALFAIVVRGALGNPLGIVVEDTTYVVDSLNATAPAITPSNTTGSSLLFHVLVNSAVTAWPAAPAGYTKQISSANTGGMCVLTKDSSTTDGAVTMSCTTSGSTRHSFGMSFEILAQTTTPAVDFVNYTGSLANTCAIPAHAVGDLIVIIATRVTGGAGTIPPTKPAAGGTVPNWIAIQNVTGNQIGTCSFYAIATATNHTSGTWSGTNISYMGACVFRGHNAADPVGGSSTKYTTEASKISNTAITMDHVDGTSQLLYYYSAYAATSQANYIEGFSTLDYPDVYNTLFRKISTVDDGAKQKSATAPSGSTCAQIIEIRN